MGNDINSTRDTRVDDRGIKVTVFQQGTVLCIKI